jgi:hypothetical protein
MTDVTLGANGCRQGTQTIAGGTTPHWLKDLFYSDQGFMGNNSNS